MSEAKEKSILDFQLQRRDGTRISLRYLLAELLEHINELETIWFHVAKGVAKPEEVEMLRELKEIIRLETDIIKLVVDILKVELQK